MHRGPQDADLLFLRIDLLPVEAGPAPATGPESRSMRPRNRLEAYTTLLIFVSLHAILRVKGEFLWMRFICFHTMKKSAIGRYLHPATPDF
jgi:hypothetical protein